MPIVTGGNKISSGAQIVDGVIGTNDLADDAVTLAKLEHGTQGDILIYDTGGAPARLATGTAGKVLTAGGAGANPTWETPSSGSKLFLSAAEVTMTDGNAGSGAGVEHTAWSTSIPANTLGTNNGIRIKGYINNLGVQGANPAFEIRVKYGGTTIATLSTTLADDEFGSVSGYWEAHILADGATNAQKGFGHGLFTTGGSEVDSSATVRFSKIAIVGSGSAAVDSTAIQTLAIAVIGTNNIASDAVLEGVIVEKIT